MESRETEAEKLFQVTISSLIIGEYGIAASCMFEAGGPAAKQQPEG